MLRRSPIGSPTKSSRPERGIRPTRATASAGPGLALIRQAAIPWPGSHSVAPNAASQDRLGHPSWCLADADRVGSRCGPLDYRHDVVIVSGRAAASARGGTGTGSFCRGAQPRHWVRALGGHVRPRTSLRARRVRSPTASTSSPTRSPLVARRSAPRRPSPGDTSPWPTSRTSRR